MGIITIITVVKTSRKTLTQDAVAEATFKLETRSCIDILNRGNKLQQEENAKVNARINKLEETLTQISFNLQSLTKSVTSLEKSFEEVQKTIQSLQFCKTERKEHSGGRS
jgi:septal ring factor EnvC (AmiA/AmiB activator)